MSQLRTLSASIGTGAQGTADLNTRGVRRLTVFWKLAATTTTADLTLNDAVPYDAAGALQVRATTTLDPDVEAALRSDPPRLGVGLTGRAAAVRGPVQLVVLVRPVLQLLGDGLVRVAVLRRTPDFALRPGDLDRLSFSLGTPRRDEAMVGPEHAGDVDAEPLRLSRHAAALRLLQYVRDEAHRFAQHYHHILRRKKLGEDKVG